MSLVNFEVLDDRIGKVALNDPDRLNAMSEGMATDFRSIIQEISEMQNKPRVLVLTGEGRAFSAGGDLEMLKNKTELAGEMNRKLMLDYYHSFLGILSLNIPIIVAINGHAIGAGLCLATACDIRIAETGSKLGFTFTRLALHPGMGATYFVPKVAGVGTARDLLLTGRVISAEEAKEKAVVSEVVESGESVNRAVELAKEILCCGPDATVQLLETLRGGHLGLEAALQREALCQSVNYAGEEYKEGVTAVIEKRKANF